MYSKDYARGNHNEKPQKQLKREKRNKITEISQTVITVQS